MARIVKPLDATILYSREQREAAIWDGDFSPMAKPDGEVIFPLDAARLPEDVESNPRETIDKLTKTVCDMIKADLSRVYVTQNPDEAPEDANLHVGDKDGIYYIPDDSTSPRSFDNEAEGGFTQNDDVRDISYGSEIVFEDGKTGVVVGLPDYLKNSETLGEDVEPSISVMGSNSSEPVDIEANKIQSITHSENSLPVSEDPPSVDPDHLQEGDTVLASGYLNDFVTTITGRREEDSEILYEYPESDRPTGGPSKDLTPSKVERVLSVEGDVDLRENEGGDRPRVFSVDQLTEGTDVLYSPPYKDVLEEATVSRISDTSIGEDEEPEVLLAVGEDGSPRYIYEDDLSEYEIRIQTEDDEDDEDSSLTPLSELNLSDASSIKKPENAGISYQFMDVYEFDSGQSVYVTEVGTGGEDIEEAHRSLANHSFVEKFAPDSVPSHYYDEDQKRMLVRGLNGDDVSTASDDLIEKVYQRQAVSAVSLQVMAANFDAHHDNTRILPDGTVAFHDIDHSAGDITGGSTGTKSWYESTVDRTIDELQSTLSSAGIELSNTEIMEVTSRVAHHITENNQEDMLDYQESVSEDVEPFAENVVSNVENFARVQSLVEDQDVDLGEAYQNVFGTNLPSWFDPDEARSVALDMSDYPDFFD